MGAMQSAVRLLQSLAEKPCGGQAVILFNLSEQCFRSFFNQYTNPHRELFVALVLDQILLACPNSSFLLYSRDGNDAPGFVADEVFQSYAAIWLHEHGHTGFHCVSSLTLPQAQLERLFGSLDLAITSDPGLIRALDSSACPLIALMGTTKSFSRIHELRPLLHASPFHHARTVSEIHAIASAVGSLLGNGDHSEKGVNDFSMPQPTASRSRRARLTRHLPFLAAIPSRRPPAAGQQLGYDDAGSSAIEKQPEFDIHAPDLESSLLTLTEAHFHNLATHPERLASDLASITFDGDPSFVPDMLESDALHDEDYLVFRGFDDPDSMILDVGANWGYSVSSIENSGAKSRIVSFEAIPMYRPCLAAVAELRPRKYHYFMTALSDTPSELMFTVPVVNNQALSALTTAADHPSTLSIVRNVVSHIQHWMSDLQTFRYQLVSFRVPVQRLDDVIDSNADTFKGRSVVAIKIDVEGMEYPVLRGAENLISQHHPLIMAEGGLNNSSLIQYLEGLGYQVADRSGSTLRLASPSTASGINGFFVHRDRLEQYRTAGILG